MAGSSPRESSRTVLADVGEANRLVEQRLVGNDFSAAHAGVGADHEPRLAVVDPRGEARRGETAEDDGMDRSEPRAGQHGDRSGRDIRQVDQHAVAPAYAMRAQHRGHVVHLAVQLAESERDRFIRLAGNADERRMIGPSGEMAIDRVVAEVRGAAGKPLHEGRVGIIADLPPGRLPVDQAGLLRPERGGIVE